MASTQLVFIRSPAPSLLLPFGRAKACRNRSRHAVRCSHGDVLQASGIQALRDLGVAGMVTVGAYLWVQSFELLTGRGVLDQKLSRKLVHITTGPMFLISWSLFSPSPWSRYAAGLVPLANAARLLVLGLGLRRNDGVVRSMSRSGDASELLRGPLYYVVVLLTSTVCFWRESPVGIMALAMMCGGDGAADIIGRRFGIRKLPYNGAKSWAGSAAMFVVGFSLSMALACFFSGLGYFRLDFKDYAVRAVLVCLGATIMESLPITEALDDNLVVPGTVIVLGMLLFPGH